jgi:hypothetical protein
VQFICQFIHWVDPWEFRFFSVPYRFWWLILCHICSWQRFSPMLFAFSLVTISFVTEKHFSLMQSHFSVLSLIYWDSGVLFRKLLPRPIHFSEYIYVCVYIYICIYINLYLYIYYMYKYIFKTCIHVFILCIYNKIYANMWTKKHVYLYTTYIYCLIAMTTC